MYLSNSRFKHEKCLLSVNFSLFTEALHSDVSLPPASFVKNANLLLSAVFELIKCLNKNIAGEAYLMSFFIFRFSWLFLLISFHVHQNYLAIAWILAEFSCSFESVAFENELNWCLLNHFIWCIFYHLFTHKKLHCSIFHHKNMISLKKNRHCLTENIIGT